MDMWPLIRGEVDESPRTEMLISDTTLISGQWKFMQAKFRYAVWQSPVWPMASTPGQEVLENTVLDCVGNHGDAPCLFNIMEDESEYVNVAHLFPDVTTQMQQRLDELKKDFFVPEEFFVGEDSCPEMYMLKVEVGVDDTIKELGCGCWMAMYNYNGFDGPYQDLEETHVSFDVETLPTEALRHAEVDDHENNNHQHEKEKEKEKDFSDQEDFSDQFEHEQVNHVGDFISGGNGRLEEEMEMELLRKKREVGGRVNGPA